MLGTLQCCLARLAFLRPASARIQFRLRIHGPVVFYGPGRKVKRTSLFLARHSSL